MYVPSRSHKLELMRKAPLFRHLNERQLSAIVKYIVPRQVGRGAYLTRKGQRASEAYVIVDGRATVEVGGKAVAALGPGDLLGELSIIDGKPRTATVIAETPMSLLAIRRQDFRFLRETVPGLEDKLLATLCERLRQADQALGH
jgi:CRP/FNR family cyclic AMP-dependent transcriptional regulator